MIKRFFEDTKKYIGYTTDSARAFLKAEVANSYLNWIWWILEPLCFMAIFYLVFGVFFNLKEDFMICFIMLGISLWDFFNHMMTDSVNIMRNNKSIVSKVYLPKHVLILVKLGVNGFKLLISFGIVAILMIIFQVKVSWTLVIVIPILITFLLFTFAISCFLLHFGVFVADLQNIVRIILRLLFYLSGVFYSIENRIPAPYSSILLDINPIAYIINAMRAAALYKTIPNMYVLLGWFIISLLLAMLAVYVVYKNENSYVKSI